MKKSKAKYNKKTAQLLERIKKASLSIVDYDEKAIVKIMKRFYSKIDKAFTDYKTFDSLEEAYLASSVSSVYSASSVSSVYLASSVSSAYSASLTSLVSSASLASSAYSASSVSSAYSAYSTSSVYSVYSVYSASSAYSAYSASSAYSTSIDYWFGRFCFTYEYVQKPFDRKPSKKDYLFLELSELLLQAKEKGLGYVFLEKNILYMFPKPIVKIDNRNNFHSDDGPAIYWKRGNIKIYYIHGVEVPDKVVVSPEKLNKKDWIDEKNLEKRRVIQEKMKERFATEIGGKVISKDDNDRIGELVEIDIRPDPEKISLYLHAQDWSSDKWYFLRVPPSIKTAREGQAWTYSMKEYKEVMRT